MNTHIRALTKRAYGYHSPEALIGMAMLTRGGLCRPYQGETDPGKRQEILTPTVRTTHPNRPVSDPRT